MFLMENEEKELGYVLYQQTINTIFLWVVLFEQRIISPYVYIEPYKDSFHYTLKCIKVQSIFNGDFTLHR